MKRIAPLLLLALGLTLGTGCSMSAQNQAIVTANSIHDIATTQNQVIASYCTPKYQAAKTKAEIATIDKTCLPAETSYLAVKAAWQTLVSVIELAKVGKATEADLATAASNLTSVITDLANVVVSIQTMNATQASAKGTK